MDHGPLATDHWRACIHTPHALHAYITYVIRCMHTYIQVGCSATVRTYIHTCMHTYIHTYMNTLHTYMHAYIHTGGLLSHRACMHTYIPTYVHTYIHTGGLLSHRSASVLAAFAAETANGGACSAIYGAVGLQAYLGEGVSVLRPLDVRASLGGALPLLPLIEQVRRPLD